MDNDVTGSVWSEIVILHGAEQVASYLDGPAAGLPAVTRHAYGSGSAWYVSTRLAADGLDALLHAAIADTTLTPRDLPRDVEVVERFGTEGRYLFAINHTDANATVHVGEPGTELLTGDDVIDDLHVPGGTVRVVFRSW